jgi:uncharacterized protein (DUF1800 family)
MSENDLTLVAHLMRRAGFGATRDELEEYVAKGYEAVVEELVDPGSDLAVEEDMLERYYGSEQPEVGNWLYRMLNTKHPLEEKMALFWHHVLATGVGKTENPLSSGIQIDMFRRVGLSDLRTVLLEVSKDPAMIYWLDNNENRKGEPNENYGRELLELFSMGVGNYTEDDVKMAARAFTGWTFAQPIPVYPHGYYPTEFLYREDDHDDSVKTFLGETGRFNGEDIVNIIVKQPATARFISRHLYNFFVADEPQVPAWPIEPPQDPDAIETLVKAFFESDGDLASILRVLFNSDFFKEALFKKVKSPAELVTGILKLVGTYQSPEPGLVSYGGATSLMGQQLLNPPTVEGWHTGREWINGGTLNERINFAVNEVADSTKPGIQSIVDRLSREASASGGLSPEELTERCLDLLGPMTVSDKTRSSLLEEAESGGELGFGADEEREESASRIVNMLQLIVATKEFQLA